MATVVLAVWMVRPDLSQLKASTSALKTQADEAKTSIDNLQLANEQLTEQLRGSRARLDVDYVEVRQGQFDAFVSGQLTDSVRVAQNALGQELADGSAGLSTAFPCSLAALDTSEWPGIAGVASSGEDCERSVTFLHLTAAGAADGLTYEVDQRTTGAVPAWPTTSFFDCQGLVPPADYRDRVPELLPAEGLSLGSQVSDVYVPVQVTIDGLAVGTQFNYPSYSILNIDGSTLETYTIRPQNRTGVSDSKTALVHTC